MSVAISKKNHMGRWEIYIGGVQVGHIERVKAGLWVEKYEYQVIGFTRKAMREEWVLMQSASLKEAKTYVRESLHSLDGFIWQMQKCLSHRILTNFKEK